MGMEVSVQARQVGRAVGDNRFISSVEPCEVASARRASILDLHSEDAVLVRRPQPLRMHLARPPIRPPARADAWDAPAYFAPRCSANTPLDAASA